MKNKLTIYLILHNIRSVYNVGSIFRTADAFGVEKIYLTGYTPDPAPKTALGAEKYVGWTREKNTQKLIRQLKEKNVFIISLENRVSDAININRFLSFAQKASMKKSNKFPKRYADIALILGNEITGLPKSVRSNSHTVIKIPMHGKKESLNVSVAVGIALYAIISQ